MKYMVIGSGGREHALAWKLTESPLIEKVYVAPGNVGMGRTERIECLEVGISEFNKITDKAKELEIDLVFVGPEVPLADGIVDQLQSEGVCVLGPNKKAAQLESSKTFAKEFMKKHDIPTSKFSSHRILREALEAISLWEGEFPPVVKACELAAGKGVFVVDTKQEAQTYVRHIMDNSSFPVTSDRVVLEERVSGQELSAFALFDGKSYFTLGYARDHKRLKDGDNGPNTGGMGCVCSLNLIDENLRTKINTEVFDRFLEGSKKDGIDFRGILFAGLMIDNNQNINVIEFNVRFGDPETQTLMPLFQSDLAEIFMKAANQQLDTLGPLKISDKTAIHVVMSSGGYPGLDGEKMSLEYKIENLEKVNEVSDVSVFFAGVSENQKGELINKGGRVLGVTALGDDIENARMKAYEIVDQIHFEDCFFRRDIGLVKS